MVNSFDPFRDIREWKDGLSQVALDALERHGCVLKSQVQELGRKAFARDPRISKAVLVEIEGMIGTWEPLPRSSPSEEGSAWNSDQSAQAWQTGETVRASRRGCAAVKRAIWGPMGLFPQNYLSIGVEY